MAEFPCRLEWSPVHKSAKFWRENAARLNERGQELLRTLVHLLEKSADPVVLAVACYDIGEYVRHYPRGKQYVSLSLRFSFTRYPVLFQF